MATPYTITWAEPGIMLTTMEGVITPAIFSEWSKARIAFVNEAGLDAYVAVLDVRRAMPSELNVQVALGVARSDPRLCYAVVVGSSMIVRVLANILGNITKLKVSLVDSLETALKLSRQELAKWTVESQQLHSEG